MLGPRSLTLADKCVVAVDNAVDGIEVKVAVPVSPVVTKAATAKGATKRVASIYPPGQ